MSAEEIDRLALSFAARVQELEAEYRRKLEAQRVPRPGDEVQEWLRRMRDQATPGPRRRVLAVLLRDYTRHAMAGTPLHLPLPPEDDEENEL